MTNEQSEILIKANDETIFKFSTYEQLLLWADGELDIWKKFHSAYAEYIKGVTDGNIKQYWNLILNDFIQKQINPIQNLVSELRSQPGSAANLARNFTRSRSLISKTSHGTKVLEVAEENIDVAILLLSIWHPTLLAESVVLKNVHNMPDNVYKFFHSKLMGAYTEAQFFDRGIKGTAKVEKKALIDIKNETGETLAYLAKKVEDYDRLVDTAEKHFNSTNDKFDTLWQKKRDIAKELIQKQIKELEDLKKKYAEGLALQIPVTYWSDKAKEHRAAAYIWGLAFVVLIAAVVIFTPDILKHILESAKEVLPNFDQNSLSLLFMVTFPAFLIIWILRIIARNIITNFSHMHDSNGRAIMTQTFLALMSENKATENDRILILNALFQPLHNHSDDGSPPHWFELMMERVKKG